MRYLALALLLLSGCHEKAAVEKGQLVLMLETQRSDQGAMLLRIVGGPVSTVTAGASQLALTRDQAGTHLLLVGELQPGEVARVEIPDATQADRYLAVLEQVSQRESYVLLDPALYRITLELSAK